ncbi:GIN domain-containing protein [Pseudoduganella sp. GCM10020061]|uniref:GIN domain-containing protein n=1 Tax=Pseudoduganella sp. GCM10020061 TaxID=3317345 RepID=UPI00362B7A38
MNTFFKMSMSALVLATAAGAAVAGQEHKHVTETRPVDARTVRVKVEGLVSLKVRQGDVARLVITGDPRWVSKTVAVQKGDTINIDTEMQSGNVVSHKSVSAELTLPQLREVVSESLGATDIRGFSGTDLHLALDGAGSMKVVCNYRNVNAKLGGLGSLNIEGGDSDSYDVDLHGAGYVTLAGSSKTLKASLGGLGGLDARRFESLSVDLDMSGLGNAVVHARQNANLNLSGMGSVTVFGKPAARKVSVDGLGNVNWK